MGFEKQLIELKFRSNELLRANIILDPFSLEKIEELRADGDFKYYISGSLIGEISSPQGVLSRELVSGIQYSDSVSRSDWVEQYLANFDFKRVRLVEIPILSLRNLGVYLDSAWRQKHMGHYDNTLTDCRKALEETRRVIQSKGFINENLERRDKTDWKRYLDSDSIGEILGNIEQQLYRFTSIAAHPGKAINIEDADYALLITHATINYLKKGLNASI